MAEESRLLQLGRYWHLFASLALVCISRTEGLYVPITYVTSGLSKGAVCLDGSPPAYNFDKGYGTGINSWLVQLEATNLHFRGARVWLAVMEDLLAKGMKNAENALLSGCSAGGLASILHCDSFKALLPMGAKVKCLSDAGYFINVKDISGASYIETYFNQVVTLHGSVKNVPLSCRGRLNPSLCFFPRNLIQGVQTPVFLLNAAYNSWQIKNILAPSDADPRGSWNTCKMDINNCSPPQIKTMQAFRLQFLKTLPKSSNFTARGLYINSCYAHCQTEFQESWYMADSPVLGRTKIAKAAGDWFYDRKSFQEIDCPYPCNPTCRGSGGGGGGGTVSIDQPNL